MYDYVFSFEILQGPTKAAFYSILHVKLETAVAVLFPWIYRAWYCISSTQYQGPCEWFAFFIFIYTNFIKSTFDGFPRMYCYYMKWMYLCYFQLIYICFCSLICLPGDFAYDMNEVRHFLNSAEVLCGLLHADVSACLNTSCLSKHLINTQQASSRTDK